MLRFYFFGAPRLERDGLPLEVDTRKAIALAAYLALTPAAHNRDELATLFYPESDSTRARAALRRTLSALKHALGDNVLESDRELIGLKPDAAVWVDTLEFRRLLGKTPPTREGLTSAVELYQGDFLAGFTLRDSPAFDEWQFFETESLRRALAGALEQLVEIHSAAGAYAAGIEAARRWLALDPLHEPAHRALIRLYAADNQRAAALRQYRECVRVLDQELGVAPLPETAELYHAIQENRFAAPPKLPPASEMALPANGKRRRAKSSPTTSPKTNAPPLVGRAQELALLQSSYARIKAGGQLMVIQGEAGIGKTRLSLEFLDMPRERRAPVLTLRAYADQLTLAYAPFIEAVRAALADPAALGRLEKLDEETRAQAARLLPELAPSQALAPQEGPGAQTRFLEALRQLALVLLRGDAPGILFVDDAQWLDDASLELLSFIAHRLAVEPVGILVTWRGEEVGGDHRLRRLYADAQRAGYATLISLSRLSRGEVNELVRSAAPAALDADQKLGERLYQESEGQPFFLVEYLKLVQADTSANELPLPAGVRELIHSRLAGLSETAHQLLSTGAVIGSGFDFELLEQASGRSDQETVSGLEELVARGVLVENGARYDFTHDKVRALVYDETLLARRRLLHRRVAETLTPRADGRATDALAASIARHYQLAGLDARAADYYQRAGDYARSIYANREALEHYRAALALGNPNTAALHEAIGDLQTLLGDYAAALTSYDQAAAAYPPDSEAFAPDAKLARVYLRRGEWERAARHLDTALETTTDPGERARLTADRSLAAHQLGDDALAQTFARDALALAKDANDQRALAHAHNSLGILARNENALAEARAHLEASLALSERLNDGGTRVAALNNLALVAQASGDLPRAVDLVKAALALSNAQGDRHPQAALHNHLADLYHALGRESEAMEHLKQAVSIYMDIGGAPGEWQPEIWKLEEW